MEKIAKLIATGFYLGYIPHFPGTAGSLLGVSFYWFIKDDFRIYLSFFSLFLVLGFVSVSKAKTCFQNEDRDPPEIIIDEIIGILAVFLGIKYSVKVLLFGFLFFRFLDIVKPYPIKNIEKLPGSLGIIGDDLLAGVFTNLVLRLLTF